MQNNHFGLIYFEAKLHHQSLFFFNMNSVFIFNFFSRERGLVNMVSHGMLEKNAGCCNHGTICHNI